MLKESRKKSLGVIVCIGMWKRSRLWTFHDISRHNFFSCCCCCFYVCLCIYFIWMSRTVIEGVLRDVDEFWNLNFSIEFKFHNFNIIHLFLNLSHYFYFFYHKNISKFNSYQWIEPLELGSEWLVDSCCSNHWFVWIQSKKKPLFIYCSKKKLSKCYSQSASIFILLNDSIQFKIMISW